MARAEAVTAIRGVLVVAAIAAGLGLGADAFAQAGGAGEGGAESYPLPGSAREAYSPIGEGFESPIEPRADLKGPKPYVDEREARLRAARAAAPGLNPFFRDTELTAHSRTYWFDEDRFGSSDPKALTTGGHLTYQSGFLANTLQLRAALYTTQPLYANAYAGETLNLTEDGDQITVLGQANAKLKFAGQEVTVGRQLVRTPYINPFDVRMIPLTYEGIVLVPERHGQQPLDYIASYLWRYKPRDSASFVPLSEAFGVEQDEGVLITGIRRRTERLNYGVVNYWINDTMNTLYGEVDYALPIGGGDGQPRFRVSVNDADQRSVGADLIPGPAFATYQASARLVADYRGLVVTGAMSRVGDDASLLKPFGSSPSYTSMIISSFTRAGEQGYVASLSYDLSHVGLQGLKVHAGWGTGVDAIDPDTGRAASDRNELDFRLEYEPHGGPLEGLQLKLEHVNIWASEASNPSDELKEFRAIANYKLPLL
jgi:outer membrane porin, OprD family